jgi:lambda repressor-like predicted transcriptional regulator
MKIKDIDNYIIDVLWMDAWEIWFNDFTEEQKKECEKYNS